MDSRGWIPISLIASFNRVRSLTPDETLVKEVLVLSTVVQVYGDWVRMNKWEQFVLPDARLSVVEPADSHTEVQPQISTSDSYVVIGEEEEEEDEVEFVMGKEAGWTPDHPHR